MSRTHSTVLFCSLIALLATGWWLLPSRVDAVPVAPATKSAWLPAEAAGAATAEVGGPDAAAAASERSASRTEAADAPPLDAPAAGFRTHGTITVRDPLGTENATCNGSMQLDLMIVDDADLGIFEVHRQTVTVTSGRWEATAPGGASKLRTRSIELEGAQALCTDEPDLATPEQPIALHASWPTPLRVRVLGDDTGADLADLRVVQMHDWMLDDCPHPGNTDLLEVLAHAASPLRIPNASSREEERYWIKAPGYAWNQIKLATTEPGERVLRLKPGSDVDLIVVGSLPPDTVLRVRPGQGEAENRPFAQLQPAANGITRIDALPLGSWSLALEKGDWFADRVVVGRTTTAVTDGAITPATITVNADVLRPSTTVVRGTLRVSPKWGTEVGLDALRAGKRRTVISLDIDPTGEVSAWQEPTMLHLDEMTKVGDGEYRWGPTALCAGRYQIVVRDCEHRTIVLIGPEHATDITIVVPEPNEVRVRVLDAGSGQPIAGAAPTWTRRIAGWQGGWSSAQMREVGDGWYDFLAPVGDLEISVHPEGYGWLDTKHVVCSGSNEFVVRVDRVCGVEIVLKDGDVTLPWPDDVSADIEHITSKATAAYWSGNKIAAKEPGEHTLTMQPLEGYLPIPPRRVSIEAAKWTPVEIVLQRKP